MMPQFEYFTGARTLKIIKTIDKNCSIKRMTETCDDVGLHVVGNLP